MLQSMTGFGQSSTILSNKKIVVEIRTLNNKGIDIYLKVPHHYKAFESIIRKRISDKLQRGKIECSITEELMGDAIEKSINKKKVLAYHKELKALSFQMDEPLTDVFKTILSLPEVFQQSEDEISKENWQKIEQALEESLENTTAFRMKEGRTLIADFTKAIDEIERLLLEVPKYETVRIEQIKERIKSNLEQLNVEVDYNRFEQELIYYIEKIDISEEKTRLQHHLDYFRQTIDKEDVVGKKLGFIAQEIGREINTLGSKSYQAELQKIVVNMKDNLEKIKEQVLNTL